MSTDDSKERAVIAEAEAVIAKEKAVIAGAEAVIAEEKAIIAEEKKHLVRVSISTTSGFYPAEGFNEVRDHQKVELELEKAKKELKIKDTAGWVATVTSPAGKRTIDPAKTYNENGLSGEVEIDWGPSEGGGG